jgi:ATP-dependent Clp protease ATP-binding subunit ClpB
VFNVLLQVLDDGRLTDAQGRTVNFKNTVVIMTSNVGSPFLLDGVSASGEVTEHARAAVMGELRAHFRPEFLNRVDEIVLFTPLSLAEIELIVDLQIESVRSRLRDRRIDVQLTEAGRAHVARAGYDPVYGARPLRRYIQREVETKIGRALLSGEIREGATIVVDAVDGRIEVRHEGPPAPAAAPDAEGALA